MQRFSRQALIYVGTEAVYGTAMGMYGFILNLFFLSLGLTAAQIGVITGAGIVVMGCAPCRWAFWPAEQAAKTCMRAVYC